jgi:hypothetical protein
MSQIGDFMVFTPCGSVLRLLVEVATSSTTLAHHWCACQAGDADPGSDVIIRESG